MTANGSGIEPAVWREGVGRALTPPVWDAVKLATRGLLNPEIGQRLFKSRNTIKTQLREASRALAPFASGAGVLSLDRAGMAVVCLKARRNDWMPCPQAWASGFEAALLPADHRIAREALRLQAEGRFAGHARRMSPDLWTLYQRARPFFARAGLETDPGALPDLLVRSGVVTTREGLRCWRECVAAAVTSSREIEALHWVSAGLTNQVVADKMGISPLTVKMHLGRTVARLAPYGAFVGVEYPNNRAGLAVIASLSGLSDKFQERVVE